MIWVGIGALHDMAVGWRRAAAQRSNLNRDVLLVEVCGWAGGLKDLDTHRAGLTAQECHGGCGGWGTVEFSNELAIVPLKSLGTVLGEDEG